MRISYSVPLAYKKSLQSLNFTLPNPQVQQLTRKQDQEIEALKEEIHLLKQQIAHWEEKYEAQEKAHNMEIVQLKCNLDNSIFNEPEEEDEGLQVIMEENEFKSMVQSSENPIPKSANMIEVLNILSTIEVEGENLHRDNDTFITWKLKQIIDMIGKLEMQVEDWKRSYWSLEKKFNQMEASSFQKGHQEIEIEFDFDKKQIVSYKGLNNDQNKKVTSQSHNDIMALKTQIDELKLIIEEQQKLLKSKNQIQQLIQSKKPLSQVKEPGNKSQTKSSHQQVKLTTKQEPARYQPYMIQPITTTRDHYFSHYFQQQQRIQSTRHSPMSGNQKLQFAKVNATQFSKDYSMEQPYIPSVYSTPIVIKNSSLSPYGKTQTKYLQF